MNVCLGQSATFTNSSSGTVTSYSWNFGSGASPATATTVGPHTVTYSTTGLKTISLTVTNSAGPNTITKTDYINIDGSCLNTDIGALSLLTPLSSDCPSSANPLQVQLKNYGTSTINFATTPVTINLQATDPLAAVQSFSKVVNTGKLAGAATLDVTLNGTYDMLTSGNYLFNASTTLAGDANSTNNSMVTDTVIIGQGFQSDYTVMLEDMGVVTATTAISAHETNDGFTNVNLTMSGTADVRVTVPSTGYTNASGGANVFFTNTAGRNFIISGINTTGYSNLKLSFGLLKASNTTTGSELSLQVSTDGTNYTNLVIPALPISNTSWNYVTATGTIPAVPNLRIKFTQTASIAGVQFRIDDLLLSNHVSQPTITNTGALTFCQGGSVTLTSSAANSYLWSNGETTQSITPTTSGSYYVVQTNVNGCTASSSALTVTANPTYSTPQTRYMATGDSFTLPSGQVVSTAGTYTSPFTTTLGCDSSIVTTLVVIDPNDNSLCTNDFVDGLSGAITHTAVNTDDGNPCTIDGCNPLTGVFHTAATEICGNGIDDNCNGLIDENCPVTLSLKVLIDGLYLGSGLMTASVNPTSNPTLCDTITVELHSNVSPYALLYSVKSTINTSGNGSFVFPTARAFSYYIVVKHRNALETWSASAILFNAATVSYDFTTAANKAFGNNQKSLTGGVFGIYSGDIDHDGSITTTDFSDVETKARTIYFRIFY
ncbi:MAG: PKD domain-containing protein [Bacteroidetes bacterium]|nr:PKD domain-containing protein [Bacteroidota bacterium]